MDKLTDNRLAHLKASAESRKKWELDMAKKVGYISAQSYYDAYPSHLEEDDYAQRLPLDAAMTWLRDKMPVLWDEEEMLTILYYARIAQMIMMLPPDTHYRKMSDGKFEFDIQGTKVYGNSLPAVLDEIVNQCWRETLRHPFEMQV